MFFVICIPGPVPRFRSMIWSVAAMAPQLGSIDGRGRGYGARQRRRCAGGGRRRGAAPVPGPVPGPVPTPLPDDLERCCYGATVRERRRPRARLRGAAAGTATGRGRAGAALGGGRGAAPVPGLDPHHCSMIWSVRRPRVRLRGHGRARPCAAAPALQRHSCSLCTI